MDYKAEVLNPKWWLIINAIGIGFIGLELLLSLGVIVTLSTASTSTTVG